MRSEFEGAEESWLVPGGQTSLTKALYWSCKDIYIMQWTSCNYVYLFMFSLPSLEAGKRN